MDTILSQSLWFRQQTPKRFSKVWKTWFWLKTTLVGVQHSPYPPHTHFLYDFQWFTWWEHLSANWPQSQNCWLMLWGIALNPHQSNAFYSFTHLFQAVTWVWDIQHVMKTWSVGCLMQSEVCLIGSAGVPLSTTINGLHWVPITWSQQESNFCLRWNSTMTQAINAGLSALWMLSGINGVSMD